MSKKTVWIAVTSILVAEAFVVGITMWLADSGRDSVRAQESAAPTPKPVPTGESEPQDPDDEELKRLITARVIDKEWTPEELAEVEANWGNHDLPIVVVDEAGEFAAPAAPALRAYVEDPYEFPSWPGDRNLVFNNETYVPLPDGVEIVRIVLLGMCTENPCPLLPSYMLQKGHRFAWVDAKGWLYAARGREDDLPFFEFVNTDRAPAPKR